MLVLKYRIELLTAPYHGAVIPLNYKSLVEVVRLELTINTV